MIFSTKKCLKGEYGYLNYQHFFALLKTLALFILALAIFFGGYLYYGNKENIVTVLSVLTLLPACHMLVIFIMFLRFSTRSERNYKLVKEIISDNTPVFFDSVLTIEKGGSYPVNEFVCLSGNLIGYTDDEKTDTALLEKHIRVMLKNNKIEKVSVKVFDKEDAFLTRLKDIVDSFDKEDDAARDKDLEAIALISAISL